MACNTKTRIARKKEVSDKFVFSETYVPSVEMDAGGSKRSPAKRRRTKATNETKATQTERNTTEKGRDLNLLPNMPLDILFTVSRLLSAILPTDQCRQIFGMLSARDFINLTRVDASFCRTLTLPDVSFVWKGARDAEEGLEPPRGIPEYRWANLFFGGLVCNVGRNCGHMDLLNLVVSVLWSQKSLC